MKQATFEVVNDLKKIISAWTETENEALKNILIFMDTKMYMKL